MSARAPKCAKVFYNRALHACFPADPGLTQQQLAVRLDRRGDAVFRALTSNSASDYAATNNRNSIISIIS
jgi:hypothetical protein